jgi:hypothetical protein
MPLQNRSGPIPAADHALCNRALAFRLPITLLVENEVPGRLPKWLLANLWKVVRQPNSLRATFNEVIHADFAYEW